ncbi:uncharacterized protein LOC119636877 isoform X2 [Glossina fuscipes]|uniref:Uncharacterized protein LOC119636877 isoform X2 n=1 Tax=Glossina fuscipes TaxID=7396 RepID=A0A9C5Z2V8_9MUSC|nr:uncharacterized protein LOC119636877 isoform X2 [Glossina fuscipes]
MSCKAYAFTCSIALITLLAIRTVAADIDDNEVNDAQDHYMIQGVKVYQGDRQCVLVGGLCVHSSDCLQPTTNKGLCPSNAHRGVECCYEFFDRPSTVLGN